MKKIIITIISIVVFFIICLITILILYNKNKLTIVPIKKEIDVYSELTLKDILGENINIIDNYKIDTSKIGKKQIDIKYKNKIFTYKETIEVNIVDKEKPVILVSDITLEKNTEIDLVNRFLCGDNYDARPNCYIEGNYNLKEIGSYPLKYIAVDSSNNKTEKEFTLRIIENKINNIEDTFTNFSDIVKEHKKENTSIGIDVSKWQGNIDFEAVKKAGCEFVIIKAAGSYVDGELYVDPRFKENIEEALKNKLQVGVYLYSDSNSVQRTNEEIDFLLELIKDYDVEYIAYDWENFTDFNSYNISFHELNSMAKTFLDKAQENGYKPLLYGSKNYLENIWDVEYETWVAQYSSKNTYNGDYVMWQLCSDGIIDGIDSYVDIDVMYK